jgi:hypothetical protein
LRTGYPGGIGNLVSRAKAKKPPLKPLNFLSLLFQNASVLLEQLAG